MSSNSEIYRALIACILSTTCQILIFTKVSLYIFIVPMSSKLNAICFQILLNHKTGNLGGILSDVVSARFSRVIIMFTNPSICIHQLLINPSFIHYTLVKTLPGLVTFTVITIILCTSLRSHQRRSAIIQILCSKSRAIVWLAEHITLYNLSPFN